MKHPTSEEWISFLYDETPENKRAELNAHLKQCADCQRQIASWQNTMGKLNAWKLPITPKARRLAEPLVKWGLAACLVLGFGFMAVRTQANSSEVTALTQQFAAETGRRDEESRALRQALASVAATAREEALVQLRSDLSRAKESFLAAASAQTEQTLTQFARSLDENRSLDQSAVANMLAQLESRRAEEMRAFRKELETVAILTEANFEKAQNQLVQLAAASNLNSNQ